MLSSRFPLILLVLSLCSHISVLAQVPREYVVIGYYAGNAAGVSQVRSKLLTHVIYSFCGLRDNRLYLADTLTVRRLVALKKQNPKLKVMIGMGGWGGCKNCSDLFASPTGREVFSRSVRRACEKLGIDGIDLDWEYPSIKGYPGHKFTLSDKQNFTKLIQQLRRTLGNSYEISFAAGAFTEYLENSVDWLPVMKEVDRVNLMTYDLVNGYSPIAGHHTALYASPFLRESADNAISYLLQLGIPANKMVIGAAFYARVWQQAGPLNNGLYQPARPKATVGIGMVETYYTDKHGFTTFWDDTAKAPYRYHPGRKLFVTYDNKRSVRLKAEYVLNKGLAGIMFWQIRLDKRRDPLLDVIDEVMRQK